MGGEAAAMKCHYCDKPATVHLTDIIAKKKREMHLCEECAREHHLIPEAQNELNIPALLQFLLGPGASKGLKGADPNRLVCPHCGIKYAQFRANGRLGCPEDYEVFRAALEPLLERIHRQTRHCGKVPGRLRTARRASEREQLKAELEAAVRDERYEDASKLRDRIRSLGCADESR
jgi:protein arginine kinase activator